jgi:hypothetical protein
MDQLFLSRPEHRPRTAQRPSRSGGWPWLSDLLAAAHLHICCRLINTFESCCPKRLLVHCGGLRDLDAIPSPNDGSSLYGTSHQYPPLSAHRSFHAGVWCFVINTCRETRFSQSKRLLSEISRGADGMLPLLSKNTSVDYNFRTLFFLWDV